MVVSNRLCHVKLCCLNTSFSGSIYAGCMILERVGLLSYCEVLYMVVYFNKFGSAQIDQFKGIQAMTITRGRVSCFGAMLKNRGDHGTVC